MSSQELKCWQENTKSQLGNRRKATCSYAKIAKLTITMLHLGKQRLQQRKNTELAKGFQVNKTKNTIK